MNDTGKTDKLIHDMIKEVPLLQHRELFEILQKNINSISTQNKGVVAHAIFESIEEIDDSQEFLMVNARQRAEYVIYLLLNDCVIGDYRIFLEYTRMNYRKLNDLDRICYWFRPNEERGREGNEERYNMMKEVIGCGVEEMLQDGIDLFDSKYYVWKNSWVLYRYLKEQGRESEFISYIQSKLTKKNVFKILGEAIIQSYGSRYESEIQREKLALLIGEDYCMDEILKDILPKTQDEAFVLELYRRMIAGEGSVESYAQWTPSL